MAAVERSSDHGCMTGNEDARPPRRPLDWKHVAREDWLPDISGEPYRDGYWADGDNTPGASARDLLEQNVETQLYANVNKCIRNMARMPIATALRLISLAHGEHAESLLQQSRDWTVSKWLFVPLEVGRFLDWEVARPSVSLTDEADRRALEGMRQAVHERYDDPECADYSSWIGWFDENIYAVTAAHPALRYVLDAPFMRGNPATRPWFMDWCTIDRLRRLLYYRYADRDDAGYYRYVPEEWRTESDGPLMRPITFAMFDELDIAIATGREPVIPPLRQLLDDRVLRREEYERIIKYGPDVFNGVGWVEGAQGKEIAIRRAKNRLRAASEQQHEYREAGKDKKPPRRRAPGALPPADPTQPKPKRKPRRGKPTGA